MGKGHTTNLSIGISLLHANKEQYRNSAEKIFALFPEIPVTWCIPSHPFLENRDNDYGYIISEIRERAKQVGDAVLPVGFSGAPHQLLTEKEVKKELAWGIKNPWKSGVADIFSNSMRYFVPVETDFNRQQIVKQYAQKGIKGIILPAPPDSPYMFRREPVSDIHIFNAFSFLLMEKRKPEKELKLYFPRPIQNIFVMVSPESEVHIDLLMLLRKFLEKQATVSCCSFPEIVQAVPIPEKKIPAAKKFFPGLPLTSVPCDDPVSRARLLKSAAIRQKDPDSNDTVREILSNTATATTAGRAEKLLAQKKTLLLPARIYTAHMPGEILLPGQNFDVKLNKGKLVDFFYNEHRYLPNLPSSSFISDRNVKKEFIYDRMFSFDTEDIRGLESILSFGGQKESAVCSISYYFHSECPWLFITSDFSFRQIPLSGDISEIAPMEIHICSLPGQETKSIISLYPDGTESRTEFRNANSRSILFGSVFSIEQEGKYIVFGFLPNKSSPIMPIPCITRSNRKQAVVSINPFGTYNYTPHFPYAGFAEQLTFFIGLRDEAPDRIPFFPNALLKSLPQPATMRVK
ncbi:MAG: hypothetical protein JW904_09175 [Spirochaetales bacterium]|nr:hypothetical protein [Spirochaetales bacterium]